MEKSEKVLWDKCFESMSEDEYCSTTLGKLNDIFKEYLLKKAAAYDRMMSGGKKTLKEWANIFGKPVAVDKFSGIVFDEIPELLRTVEAWRSPYGYVGKIPSCNIYFTGSWQDSLTLPDGWEENHDNN